MMMQVGAAWVKGSVRTRLGDGRGVETNASAGVTARAKRLKVSPLASA
jgi:hypothetical protein